MRRRSEPLDEIRLTDDGFKLLRNGTLQYRVEWRRVTGIAAFKRDLFASDQICLAFRTANLEYPYVTEHMAGYDVLLGEISRRFPDHDPDWFRKVMAPAFDLCWTVVWGDAPQPIECPRCGYDLRGTGNLHCPECGETLPADVCPDCAGRGRFRVLSFLWWGLGGIAVGLVVFVGATLLPGLPRFLRDLLTTVGGALTLVGCVSALMNLMSMDTTCRRCGGDGRIKKDNTVDVPSDGREGIPRE